MTTPVVPDIPKQIETQIDQIRSDFPILSQQKKGEPICYLDNGASAQKPNAVIQAESEVYQTCYANAYRGVYDFGAEVDEQLEASRQTTAQFLNAASAQEIIFTSGTTMSLNMVAQAWGTKFLNAGDEILISAMEHHANIVPWQMVAQQTGAVVKVIPLNEQFEIDLEAYASLLCEKTKMVSVTATSNMLGTIPPIAHMAKMAHEQGAVICVDAAQSVPHLRTDVQAEEIDFLAFSGHKVFGPSGIGVLYGKADLLEQMNPYMGGGHMISTVSWDGSTYAQAPAKFEAGTLPIAQAIALKPALDYVSRLGHASIQAYETELLSYAHQQLQQIPDLTIWGPDLAHKGPITSFTIQGAHPEDLAQLLNRCGVFVRHGHHCTMPLHEQLGLSATVRASYALYNTRQEIDRLIEAIEFARKKLRLS